MSTITRGLETSAPTNSASNAKKDTSAPNKKTLRPPLHVLRPIQLRPPQLRPLKLLSLMQTKTLRPIKKDASAPTTSASTTSAPPNVSYFSYFRFGSLNHKAKLKMKFILL